MAVDEGFQATFASLTTAAARARQLLVVGDSGQIGPIVTVNTAPFAKWHVDPHLRAPEVLLDRARSTALPMGTSYRLGPVSVAVVAPLYSFPVVTARPERWLTDPVGTVLPEVARIDCGTVGHHDDEAMLSAVAARAAALVGARRHEADRDGTGISVVPLNQRNVVAVVSRNTQRTFIRARLDAMALRDVVVDTADRLQGGQWAAVVALDPLAGATEATAHAMSLGRLCVMVSRHTTHLTWVHDDGWAALLADERIDHPDRSRAVLVREMLCASPTA